MYVLGEGMRCGVFFKTNTRTIAVKIEKGRFFGSIVRYGKGFIFEWGRGFLFCFNASYKR